MTTQHTEYGTINEVELERLRARMHKPRRIEQPYVRFLNEDSITHAARAIGDRNPLYTDPDYAKQTRFGKLVAPPAILYGAGWGSWDLRRGAGLPGVHGFHAGDRWTYYRPLLAGDEIIATSELVQADRMQGRMAGRAMLMQARDISFRNQHDELLAIQHMSIIRAERGESRKRGRYTDTELATYSEEDIAQIEAELDAEMPRGGEQRYWEDTNVGDELTPCVKGPLTVTDMIAWMMGMGSPHLRSGKYWLDYRRRSPKIAIRDPESGIPEPVERVHWDPFVASEIGLPSGYDYGSQRGGYASYFATNWVGDDGWLAMLDVQYRGICFLRDVIRMSGTVVDKWRGASGTGYVAFTFSSVTQRGQDIMPGRGVAALPSKESGPVGFSIDAYGEGGVRHSFAGESR